MNDEITFIYKEIDNRKKESSDDTDKLRNVKRRKIIIRFAVNEIKKMKNIQRYFTDTCSDKPRMHLGDYFIKYHTKQQYRI